MAAAEHLTPHAQRSDTLTTTPHEQIAELLTASPRFVELSPSAKQYCADAGVLRRYIDCAAALDCPAEENVGFLLATAQWRDEQRIDALLQSEADLAFERGLRPLLLYDLTTDSRGRPLMIERIGAWDVGALTAVADAQAEEVTRAHILVSEWIRQAVDTLGRTRLTPKDRQATLIFDMEGIGWSHLRATTIMNLFSTMSSMDSNHFPDTLGTIFIVNTSRLFSLLWSAASNFLAESTCQKVQVFAWNDVEAMQAAVIETCGVECLPQELGGKRTNAPPYHFEKVAAPLK